MSVSIEEARQILGYEAKNMSDQQIEDLLDDIEVLAKYALKMAREKIKKENDEKSFKNTGN